MARKFHRRRAHGKGRMLIETGFRNSEVTLRLTGLPGQPINLSYQDACDLADVLNEALDEQDDDPLL